MRATMMDAPLTITSIMRYGATAYSDREVITAVPGGVRRRTYREIGARTAALAGALRSLGVDSDQRVATLMWNNAEHLEAYLGIPSMGAVLHTLNLRLDPETIGYIAEHAGDEVVIADATLVPLLAAVLPHAPSIRHIIVSAPDTSETGFAPPAELAGSGREVHSYAGLLAGQPVEFDWPELDERTAAAMCYTSGTTGHPKGVVYSHRSMYLHSMAVGMGNVFGLSDRDRVLPVVPMFHANAWGLPYAAVLAGADLVMPDRFLQPAPLAELIEAERPTIAGAVPTIWNGLLQHVRAHGGDLSSLRLVPCGGSAVPHALLEAYEKELGVRIVQAWGMTETSPLGSVAREPVGVPEDQAWSYRDTQGRLMCLVEGRLVGEGGAVLPHDGEAVGEVEVRGPWVTGSYYKDDDPGKFRDGWLRTGDVGTIDPLGYVTLTDRAKDVIKSGGEWISSMELENALMAHPGVSEAAVIGVPDDKWGERPLAAVVRAGGSEVTAAELRAFLAERVPRWQLPERWSFIEEVPKTSVGKFAKTTMRDAYARGDYEVTEAR
ncbi:MAG TPA: long-chain fatty acid--CoA ligase [Streptosporangiaceae bacterium]|nr:long-chain fatty acid--CoA ligase [Streptosporangiaceae bacterium]